MRDHRVVESGNHGRQAEPSSDVELDTAMSSGDRRYVLTILMNRFGDGIYRFALVSMGDAEIAADIRQQVFLEAYRDLETYARRASVASWLFGIARHRCLDAVKAKRRWSTRFTSDDTAECADDHPAPDRQIDRGRVLHALRACVARLAPASRQAVLLRYRDELSYHEVAAIVGDSPSTVEQRVRRALPKLRSYLAESLSPEAATRIVYPFTVRSRCP